LSAAAAGHRVRAARAIYVSDAGNFQNPPWQILKFDEDAGTRRVHRQNLAWPQDILFVEASGSVLVSN